MLDVTVVNIALPSAQPALHFSTGNRQWVVTAYSRPPSRPSGAWPRAHPEPVLALDPLRQPVLALPTAAGVLILLRQRPATTKPHLDIPGTLLPLRLLDDRNRSGAYPAVLLVGVGLFGVFLLLTYCDRMLLIPGTSSVAHLEENMAAIEIELDDGDLAALDRVEQRDDGAE